MMTYGTRSPYCGSLLGSDNILLEATSAPGGGGPFLLCKTINSCVGRARHANLYVPSFTSLENMKSLTETLSSRSFVQDR